MTKPTGRPDRERALGSYRELADGYDASCRSIVGIRADAIAALALQPGETVFDVACGTGTSLVELARRVGSSGRVVGIEQCPEMAAIARAKIEAAGLADRVSLCVASVEEARIGARADALLFCYTHDVLQSPAALANIIMRVKPGARVAVVGVRLQPWWWGWPLNAVTLWRGRRYLTTSRGLREPWRPLAQRCPGLRIERHYHLGTSYLAVGRIPEADSRRVPSRI